MFLTKEETEQLTGRKTRNAQIRHLRRLGISHYFDADGRPVVARSEVEALKAEDSTAEPDWSALHVPQKTTP